jgi:hypothetical protein
MCLLIDSVCDNIAELLKQKNKQYGNSALKAVNVFNKDISKNSIPVRIDDKINRIINAESPGKNDTVDLLGYLVLYIIDQGWHEFQDLVE